MWIIILILVQTVIAGAVIFVLKRLLDRELIEAALEKAQAVALTPLPEAIVVTSAGTLNVQASQRFQSIFKRKAPDVNIVFEQDPALQGGVVIAWGREHLDFSIASRLKNFWS